jgi:hypothetical protein
MEHFNTSVQKFEFECDAIDSQLLKSNIDMYKCESRDIRREKRIATWLL